MFSAFYQVQSQNSLFLVSQIVQNYIFGSHFQGLELISEALRVNVAFLARFIQTLQF